MKRFAYLLLALCLGLASFTVSAVELKIGFIDGNKIIAKYEPQIDAKLQDEFKAQQEKVVTLQKKLMEQSDKYKKDAAIMSETDLNVLKAEFDKNNAEFQRLSADYNQKRGARSNEELNKLLENVKSVAKTVAAKNSINVVFQRGAAVYIDNDGMDLTDQVMKELSYK